MMFQCSSSDNTINKIHTIILVSMAMLMLLLQKHITGLFLQLHNDAKALVALVGEIEKLRGRVSMFPRLISYSSAPSTTANLTGVKLGSRTFWRVQFSSLTVPYIRM